MTAILSDLEERIGLERIVLSRAMPLLPNTHASMAIDLDDDSPTVVVSASDSFGSSPTDLNMDDLRPLLVGAGWKVLDQLIEFRLEQLGISPDRGRDYSNKSKVDKAESGEVTPLLPFVAEPDLWIRAMKTYASTQELRDSIVHRRPIRCPHRDPEGT